MEGLITMQDIKLGYVNLEDLVKINAMLDMKADIEKHYSDKMKAEMRK